MPVIVPAGMMSKPPECRGDEASTRGHRNSLRQQGSPAGVLYGERDGGYVMETGTNVKGNVTKAIGAAGADWRLCNRRE